MPDKFDFDSQKYMDDRRKRLLWAVSKLELRMSDFDLGGFCVMQVTIQTPQHTGKDWRAIVKGETDRGDRSVAFANAEGVEELLVIVAKGLEEGFLSWREDKPWNPPVPPPKPKEGKDT